MGKGKGTPQERKMILYQPSYVRHMVSTTFFTVGLSMIGKAVAVNRNLSVRCITFVFALIKARAYASFDDERKARC